MFRAVLGDYVKEIYPGMELQVNFVNWWNKELEVWEQTYRLVLHWQDIKRFKKPFHHTVSLLWSTDKDLVIKMFEMVQNNKDLYENLQVFKNIYEIKEEDKCQ